MPHNTVLLGDCLDILRETPSDSIDAIVSDPPYGLGTKEPTMAQIEAYLQGARLDTGGDFMGAKWEIPTVEVWRECLRVLKPGRHICCFAGCYDEHTEVLTRRGWVRFPDVVGDEGFASLNLETHKVEWQRAKEVVRQPNPGGMYRYTAEGVDLLVTSNHNMLIAPLGTPEPRFRLERADQHGDAFCMTKTSRGRADTADLGLFALPAVSQITSRGRKVEVPAKEIPLDVWLAFFGLWLAEGSVSIKARNGQGSGHRVLITHFDEGALRTMKGMLDPWFDVQLHLEVGELRIYGKQLAVYLSQFGGAWDRFIPDWIKALPAHRLRVLWDWYMQGDGIRQDCTAALTSSSRLCDDWQEVAMYMGMAVDWRACKVRVSPARTKGYIVHRRHPQYVLEFRKEVQPVFRHRPFGTPVRIRVSPEEWAGRTVYCVELEQHHTLYVRRNGKAVWCGNTRTWDIMLAGMKAAGFTEDGCLGIPFGMPMICWIHSQGFPKSLNIAKAIDKMMGAKSTVSGPLPGAGCPDTGPEEQGAGLIASVTVEAKKWEGWGTALKPAWEPILTLRKPGTTPEGLLPMTIPFLYCHKVAQSEADAGIDARMHALGHSDLARNIHPTRKSVTLMEWIIRHASARDWTVLDPYCGSGSTLVAAVNTGRGFLGIERETVYRDIALRRIAAARKTSMAGAQDVFDMFMEDE